MYSDQISTGRKRSIHERLDGDLPAGSGAGGRARHYVSKSCMDFYSVNVFVGPQRYRESMDPRDLRLKLQRRSSQPGFAGTKSSGVRDLREKLSGTMHPQPSNADPPKPKPVSEVVKITRRENAAEVPVRQSKKASKQTTSKKISQPKAESPLDTFLSSLGLEKYSITFQAEEVDMAALRHMTDSDLKALGIPMPNVLVHVRGPRADGRNRLLRFPTQHPRGLVCRQAVEETPWRESTAIGTDLSLMGCWSCLSLCSTGYRYPEVERGRAGLALRVTNYETEPGIIHAHLNHPDDDALSKARNIIYVISKVKNTIYIIPKARNPTRRVGHK
ncbi:hypothetical protein PR202_gb26038 [Eleusine coracana subsp. coracana]|uniref:SAM domain-containing protein n=1 Tax=Eleusine coracana subsp. coracana TaxID=191504 RepID=A0AAV5FQI2_ELECO|nr:hypothetical protein PR202_gb26038 [Eleusine coracana subsp. coracana]